MIRHRSLGRKQGQLRWPLAPFIERFDDLAPRLALAVVDLAQIQYLPLHDLATSTALALDNIPIAMLLAVLQSSVASQIHASESVSNACKQALRKTKLLNRYLVYTTAVSNSSRLVSTRIFRSSSQKNQLFRPSLEKVWLAHGLSGLGSTGSPPIVFGHSFLKGQRSPIPTARRLDRRHTTREASHRGDPSQVRRFDPPRESNISGLLKETRAMNAVPFACNLHAHPSYYLLHRPRLFLGIVAIALPVDGRRPPAGLP